MTKDLIQAILTIQAHCSNCKSCKDCPVRDYCGRPVSEWVN